MYPEKPLEPTLKSPVVLGSIRTLAALVVASMLLFSLPTLAQSSGSSGDQQAQPKQNQQDDQMPAAAGGPGGEPGPIAVPKKSTSDEPPPPPKPKAPSDNPQFSLHVDVPEVTVDAQ